MRRNSIAATLAIIASVAYAEQSLFIDEDMDEDDFTPERIHCRDKATGPEFHCWYSSNMYQAKTRQEKLAELWSNIEKSQTETPAPYMWTIQQKFFTQRANGSFCSRQDAFQTRHRKKTTHTQGLVAQVEYVAVKNDLGYTGMFASGSDTIIMRLSDSHILTKSSTGLAPSIALKFLLDGKLSQNLMAMESFVSTNSWNFLEARLSNRVPEFDTTTETGYIMDQTLRKKLTEGSQRPFGLAISHIGTHENDGTQLHRKKVKVPYEIYFASPLAKNFKSEKVFAADGKQVMWYDQLTSSLKKGDVIYDVLGQYEPIWPGEDEDRMSKKVKIGELRLKTDLLTSAWADEKLYFQHRQINRDRRFWPHSWRLLDQDKFFTKADPENIFGNTTPAWPKDPVKAEQLYSEQMEKWGCPFEWLMKDGWQAAWESANL